MHHLNLERFIHMRPEYIMQHTFHITSSATLFLMAALFGGCTTSTTTITVQVISEHDRKPLKATVHIDYNLEKRFFQSRAFEPEDQYIATDRNGLIAAEIDTETTGQFIVYALGYEISSTRFTTFPPPFPHQSPVTPAQLIHYLIELKKKQ
jgi:hypothetical protein